MSLLILVGLAVVYLPAAVHRRRVKQRAKALGKGDRVPQKTGVWLTKLFPSIFPPEQLADGAQGEALLHQMAGLLRAGMPVVDAWSSLGVGTTTEGLPQSGDLMHALDSAPSKDTARQARGVVVACKLAYELGIPLAQLLIVVAGTVEDSQRSVAQREQALAGPAATGRVLLMLPVIGVVLGGLLGAQPLTWLLGKPAGWLCLSSGLALLVMGHRWTKALIHRALLAGTAP